MCEDWELGVQFLNEREGLGTDELAAESVRKKFLGDLCRADHVARLRYRLGDPSDIHRAAFGLIGLAVFFRKRSRSLQQTDPGDLRPSRISGLTPPVLDD